MLDSDEAAAVLHYSARSARIFLDLARAAEGAPSLRGATATKQSSSRRARSDGMVHLALSEDVARPLREAGCADVRAAPAPNEESLLALLRAL